MTPLLKAIEMLLKEIYAKVKHGGNFPCSKSTLHAVETAMEIEQGIKEPWAWAVVDPKCQLVDDSGDTGDYIVYWSEDAAKDRLDEELHKLEENDNEAPYIVELFPRFLLETESK